MNGRLLRTAWLLAVVAALVACSSKPPSLPRLGPDDVIVAFGDSLTFGTGAQPAESYPAVLGDLIGRDVVGAGVPGETTAQGMQRLPQVLDRYRPRLVLLCLGGNDLLRKVDEPVIEANLRAMVRTLRDRGIAVVLIGVPKPSLLPGTAAFYETIADDMQVPLEGEVLETVLVKNEFKSDPIHPNAAGYRKMAEAVAKLLRGSGAI
ncbi:MAG: arylesterase [Burkholderiales bacterium]|nr:arylesterase [Burkholderiales bacterium]